MGYLFLMDEKEKGRDPPSTVGGLEGSKKEEGNESAGRAPADLHPPLVEILPSLALQACKEMQPSHALLALNNFYASGRVTLNFNQS